MDRGGVILQSVDGYQMIASHFAYSMSFSFSFRGMGVNWWDSNIARCFMVGFLGERVRNGGNRMIFGRVEEREGVREFFWHSGESFQGIGDFWVGFGRRLGGFGVFWMKKKQTSRK